MNETLSVEDFAVQRMGYASNPWRIVHVPTGRQVSIPRVLQNGDGKDVHFTGAAAFPRKRDALVWLRDELARFLSAAPAGHTQHGRGDALSGPDDPDCPCRGTGQQGECATAGCGFCRAAPPAFERLARWEPDGRWVCECGAKSCGADFPGPTACCFTLRPERAPTTETPDNG